MTSGGADTPPLVSKQDLEFLLYEWLDVEPLTQRGEFEDHSREVFDSVLELAEDLARKKFAPHNRLADLTEPTLTKSGDVDMPSEIRDAIITISEAGLIAGEFSNELGGLQLPTVVSRAALLWLQAANISTVAYLLLTIGNAHLLAEYGTPDQVDRWVRPMLTGRHLGTMCLSEPEAGSSLAQVTTRAEATDDGEYRLFGTKTWITGGDHNITENIVHLVLARLPDAPSGVRGLSLFISPKYLVDDNGAAAERNDIALVALNHKMGQHGATNAELSFGGGAHLPGGERGAVGYLVGEEGRGLEYMFHMMNEARIGVGLGATGLGYSGYLQSLEYARTRIQGKTPGSASGHSQPIIAHPDVRRMLLAQKSYVEGALALCLYCARLVDDSKTAEDSETRRDDALLLELLTPIAKSWPSQWALEANALAIQILGGAGYTRDFPVEQLYRDNRLNPIHEGTHGIHGLDLLGRKVMMRGGQALQILINRIGETTDRAAALPGAPSAWAEQLRQVAEQITEVTDTIRDANDPDIAMANASVYLEAVGHAVVAWLWLEQVLASEGKNGDFYEGKRNAARYFFTYELPKTMPQFALLNSLDRTTVDMSEGWF